MRGLFSDGSQFVDEGTSSGHSAPTGPGRPALWVIGINPWKLETTSSCPVEVRFTPMQLAHAPMPVPG
jgi:hypothetical protein